MRIFLTGASGYVGRHVAKELLMRGHRVTGLARQASSRTTGLASVDWCFGNLADTDTLADALTASDLVVHCAMGYSEDGKENADLDAAFVEQVKASGNFLIYTGNLYSPRPDPAADLPETLIPEATDWRFRQEISLLGPDSPAAVIRLGFVYGGQGGYLWPMLPPEAIAGLDPQTLAHAHWPMVHVFDVARLYATVVEQKARGVYHAFDGSPTTARDIVESLLDIYPAEEMGAGEAHKRIHELLAKSIVTSNARSRSLGWEPKHSEFRDHAAQAYAEYQKTVGQ